VNCLIVLKFGRLIHSEPYD